MMGPDPGDRIKVYGTIRKPGVLCEYTSETGTRMIQRIHARFSEMPKDE